MEKHSSVGKSEDVMYNSQLFTSDESDFPTCNKDSAEVYEFCIDYAPHYVEPASVTIKDGYAKVTARRKPDDKKYALEGIANKTRSIRFVFGRSDSVTALIELCFQIMDDFEETLPLNLSEGCGYVFNIENYYPRKKGRKK